jgi:3-methylcrotonyl-CoA carboxylase alpha subunit
MMFRHTKQSQALRRTALKVFSSSPFIGSHIQHIQRIQQQLTTHCKLFSTSSFLSKPFDKILIANRGEIACRVIRTAKRLGVQTIALYSDVDGQDAIHAKMADEAHKIGTGPSPAESYLRGDEILDIASKSGAQAIHPGYGFLSENSIFAKQVSDANITFIGPPPSAILAMGSKSHSKKIMDDAGVPTTPGYHGENQSAEYLLHEAVTNVGFPLLIKATMGGGGKGMRLVLNETDFLSALESCRRESQAAFGDQNVILEKYLVHPRHIEIQVMADTHGNVVYLHERDCSLQRRHQKVIEEAPASDLPPNQRELMGQMAVKAAQAVGYVNAGTVEFLLDTKSEKGEFYFCEMNTRLQVEHPVTEMITNQDLVEWQLRIASGEELPILDQNMIPCDGHSMEARIYAENPLKDFLPATGNVWHHQPPAEPNVGGTDVRVDTCIETGKDITVHYDPMISKLIVHGNNRDECRQKFITALKEYQISGVPSNIPFLIKCAEHDVFAKSGLMNTGFLDEYGSDIHLSGEDELGATEQAICALVVALKIENRIGSTDKKVSDVCVGPWSNLSGSWRVGGVSGRHERLLEPVKDGHPHKANNANTKSQIRCISNHNGSFDIALESESGSDNKQNEIITIDGTLDSFNTLNVTINGTKKKSFTAITHEDIENGTITVSVWSTEINRRETDFAFGMSFHHPLPIPSTKCHRRSASLEGGSIGSFPMEAPMPGKVIRINANVGDDIIENETIVVMEAMKMEHAVLAPTSGKLEAIDCMVGDFVNDGDVLAILKVDEEKDDTHPKVEHTA